MVAAQAAWKDLESAVGPPHLENVPNSAACEIEYRKASIAPSAGAPTTVATTAATVMSSSMLYAV